MCNLIRGGYSVSVPLVGTSTKGSGVIGWMSLFYESTKVDTSTTTRLHVVTLVMLR